jgi:glycosyltransferase involved in cell wall biosynthesis
MSKTMRTLRIGFFPDFFYPHIGGAEIWVAEVAKRLHLSGHQIEIFTYRMPFAIKDEAIDGVTVHRVGWPFIVSGSRPYFIRFLILIEACFGIGLRRERFDIVLGQFTPLIPLKLVCKTRRIPLVALFHDVFGMEKNPGDG